uniref:NADH-ubiquinone oxidoreductase chain 5 n=1 Tax=Ptilodactylidae sp. 2 ACP-2013 TaxID=1434563 RepID=A0A3G5FNR9_9COLE|nr:NADH dehydrogenase subunit 5 [Ptilodactylidae sp. 2 ACP-2013]
MVLSICYLYWGNLLFFSLLSFWTSMYFMVNDLVVMIELEICEVNASLMVGSFLLDWMSLVFMSFVLFISSMVILYSEDYMAGDLNINRFILLVVMFVLSMMLLILSPNLISILLGWDGLGLVSYCLVIYYQNVKSFNAGMLTALTNRIGDVALLMAIAWMLNYGSWNYIYYLECMKESFVMMLISYLVVLAALTKSAQIPFSAWLPAAMAAPTPVSSLVHSSTLVTAGVYLLIRFHYSFPLLLESILLILSVLTMFMAGLGANFEFDLKKIIALSTLSQLGLMMSILALGGSMLAFYHLLTHALFKALLFMCAGCMIHNLLNMQDIRFMGGMIKHMPLTSSLFIISNLSLCGFPFLSGFYSKDLILEMLSMSYLNMFIYVLFFLSTGLTVCYTFRLLYYLMSGDFNFFSYTSLNDQGFKMIWGMLGLIFFVVLGGSMLMWLIFSTPVFICLPLIFKVMALLVSVVGCWLGYMIAHFSSSFTNNSLLMMRQSMFYGTMWNLPILSTFFLNSYFLNLGYYYYKMYDQGWVEYFGSQNIYSNIKNLSLMFQFFFHKKMSIFMSLIVIWLFFLIIVF